jgi:hypothetical protein
LRETVWENWGLVSGALASEPAAVPGDGDAAVTLAPVRGALGRRGERVLSSGRAVDAAALSDASALGCAAGPVAEAEARASLVAPGNEACGVGCRSPVCGVVSVLADRRIRNVVAAEATANSANPPSTPQTTLVERFATAEGGGTGVERRAQSRAELEPVPVPVLMPMLVPVPTLTLTPAAARVREKVAEDAAGASTSNAFSAAGKVPER